MRNGCTPSLAAAQNLRSAASAERWFFALFFHGKSAGQNHNPHTASKFL
jgi:hypothetical protein